MHVPPSSPRHSFPRKSSEPTREKLIDTIGLLIAQDRYEELTVMHVCQSAGLDKKLVYHHFGNINGLFTAYINRKSQNPTCVDATIAELDAREQPPLTPTELSILLDAYAQLLAEDAEFLGLVALPLFTKNLDIKAQAQDFVAAVQQKITEKFQKSAAESHQELTVKIAIILAALNYLFLHAKTSPRPFMEMYLKREIDRDRIKEVIKRSMLKGC